MLRRNKGKIILSSLMVLLPVAVGLLLWQRLPEELPVHWSLSGMVDGWGSKTFVVFDLPGCGPHGLLLSHLPQGQQHIKNPDDGK